MSEQDHDLVLVSGASGRLMASEGTVERAGANIGPSADRPTPA